MPYKRNLVDLTPLTSLVKEHYAERTGSENVFEGDIPFLFILDKKVLAHGHVLYNCLQLRTKVSILCLNLLLYEMVSLQLSCSPRKETNH